MAEWMDLDAEAEARAESRRLRSERSRQLSLAKRNAEARMTERTRTGRKYEEHGCGKAPYGWRLRRYAASPSPYDRDELPCYVWAMCRTEPPDGWVDGWECSAAVNGAADEPSYCPWCGARLDRLPACIRGWRG